MFIAAPSKENGWLVPPKTLNSPKGFSTAFFQSPGEGGGVTGYVIGSCTVP